VIMSHLRSKQRTCVVLCCVVLCSLTIRSIKFAQIPCIGSRPTSRKTYCRSFTKNTFTPSAKSALLYFKFWNGKCSDIQQYVTHYRNNNCAHIMFGKTQWKYFAGDILRGWSVKYIEVTRSTN
jgi:hypothetical protein